MFFERLANAHRRFNTIDKLDINGELEDDLVIISVEIISFDLQLYTEFEQWMLEFTYQKCPKITDEEAI